jgi:hypothetical protein
MTPDALLDIAPRTLYPNEPVTRSFVQAITVVTYPEEPPSDQVMRLVETSGALAFWDAPEEEIYTIADGTPL